MTKEAGTFIWPGIEDEANTTTFLGRAWEANIPQDVSGGFEEQTVSVRQEQKDGTVKLISKTVKVSHAEILRRNPCFNEVGGEQKVHKKRGRPAKFPNAAEEHAGPLSIGE